MKTGLDDLSTVSGSGGKNKDESKSAYALLLSAKEEVGKLLGLSVWRVSELLRIASWDEKRKEPIRQQKIAGRTAVVADRLGGKEAVEAVAKNELGFRAMEAIGSEFAALPKDTEEDMKIREGVRKRFSSGGIKKPEDVVATARQLKSKILRGADVPPDLIDVMRAWTEQAYRWARELEEVSPYAKYIDTEPRAAERWRDSVKVLIDKLQKFV
jgi:hypothetical protein